MAKAAPKDERLPAHIRPNGRTCREGKPAHAGRLTLPPSQQRPQEPGFEGLSFKGIRKTLRLVPAGGKSSSKVRRTRTAKGCPRRQVWATWGSRKPRGGAGGENTPRTREARPERRPTTTANRKRSSYAPHAPQSAPRAHPADTRCRDRHRHAKQPPRPHTKAPYRRDSKPELSPRQSNARPAAARSKPREPDQCDPTPERRGASGGPSRKRQPAGGDSRSPFNQHTKPTNSG